VQKAYRTVSKQGKANEQELTSFLVRNGQGLLAGGPPKRPRSGLFHDRGAHPKRVFCV
jgi:hypothetical protein